MSLNPVSLLNVGEHAHGKAQYKKKQKTYLSVNWGDRCHLDIEHSFVIIHPLHAWELNLQQCDIQLL